MKCVNNRVHILSILILCLVLSGCANTFSRGLEDAMGSLGRQHIEPLGPPDKGGELVKMRVSGSYAVFMQRYYVRLDDDCSNARTVLKFSHGRTDYAIIECRKIDGRLENVLVEMPQSASGLATYTLFDTSTKEFRVSARSQYTLLEQDIDNPKDTRLWFIDDSGLRKPVLLSVIEGDKRSKSNTSSPTKNAASSPKPTPPRQVKKQERVKLSEIPVINPSASARLESDDRRQGDTALADTKGKTETESPAPGSIKPVIVLGAPVAPKNEQSQSEAQEAPQPPSTTRPVIILHKTP